MNKLLSAVAVAACLVAPQAFAQGKQDFALHNKTGYTIDQVFVSPSSSNKWEEDVMGRDVLNDGESVAIGFERGDKSCKWDLKVVYDDKETAEWDGFDLCSTTDITLRYDRKGGRTWAETK